ncbi:hypothetical protein B0H22_10912 [Methanohalophilus euhalobius]|uniref:Uncharacterized protein n=1 Tax=Methanohalophilus euhalobius TaxID=51203 RepID=A0A314ZZG4_9EURY|nr:hypothetical protein B0H22_10912 [Methanohalophilus euhalobius]
MVTDDPMKETAPIHLLLKVAPEKIGNGNRKQSENHLEELINVESSSRENREW